MSDRPRPFEPVSRTATAPADAAPEQAGTHAVPGEPTQLGLVYEHGLELQARSQWAYARRRFLRHKLAMAGLILLILIALASAFAQYITPYTYDDIDLLAGTLAPTTEGRHFFGTDPIGRDYFTRVLYGIRTSLRVAIIVSLLSTLIGTTVGALAGYFGGWLDNLLMRLVDLLLVLPFLAVLLTVSAAVAGGSQYKVAIILALLLWTTLARIVRGTFLSLREKEFVEAAKASGAGNARIIFRHILPNALGPIIVNATLVVALAILLEAVLSFLGFGIQPPKAALGELIADGQGEGFHSWWLVTFPGLTIVVLVLCINFIGDGLRDALDPRKAQV